MTYWNAQIVEAFRANGGDNNPAWYHNVMANPSTTIEVGSETLAVAASEAAADERAPIWEKQKALEPGFAAYEQGTSRIIPVLLLRPT